jgi:hypothetical protein
MNELTGYMHSRYAFSLFEFGKPRELPRCGGWILERPIPGTPYRDGMNCYPLFVCRDWFKLHEDLKEIESELVSLVLVSDPFATVHQADLARYFHIAKPFKRHFIADLTRNPEYFVNKHHRYYARKSLREMHVEVCDEPSYYIDEWVKLYSNLVRRHSISGLRAFSRDSFLTQLRTPGFVLVVGKLGGEVVGGHVIATHGEVAYSHLAAFSEAAYKHRSSYGIYWMSLQYLMERGIRYFDLGAAAGVGNDAEDGLANFKIGWSNDSRTVYLCGSVFDYAKYSEIVTANGIPVIDYFPAYRNGEFG